MTDVDRSWSVMIVMGPSSVTLRSTGPVTTITTSVLDAVQALADALGAQLAGSITLEGEA